MGASHISMDMSLLEAFDRASKDTEAILDEDEDDDDDVKVQLVAEESLQVVEESQPEVPAAQSEPPFIGANESQGLPPATEPLDANGRSYSSAQPPAWLDGAQPRAISSGDGCETL